jgi:hypothetical protein
MIDKTQDAQTYEQSRQYLKGALENLLASERSLRDLFELAFDNFGEDFLPYLLQFFQDIRGGRIRIEGLGESTRDAILGHHVTPEQRDYLIQKAAYYISENHGFSRSTEQDWAEAEKEVDARLEGLIASQQEISQWLEGKASKTKKKTGTTKKTAGMAPFSISDDSNTVKKAVKKKATKKKATKKKAVKKKATKKKASKPKTE